MTTNLAERAEEARDLKRQLAELTDYDDTEILFKDTSPRRKRVDLYDTKTGEHVRILQHYAQAFLEKVHEDGTPRFTSRKDKAPTFKRGTIKCFMAADSPDQVVLQEIGIFKVCPAEHLANAFAKRMHAQKKHKAEWAAYQEHLADQEREEERSLRRQEVDAMMALAKKAAKQ